MTTLAPPELFSAFAVANDGQDLDLRKGTHLRLYTGLGASFPLTPTAVLRMRSHESEPQGVFLTDRDGMPVDQFDLSRYGMVNATLQLGDSPTRRTVWVNVMADDPAGIQGARLLDQKGRVTAERNAGPWSFSAPSFHRLQVIGTASEVRIRTRAVNVLEVGHSVPAMLAGTLGFPLKGQHPWYLGLDDREAGLKRVGIGAPQRLTPMDRPQGPFDAVDEGDEIARVEALLQSMGVGGGVEALLRTLFDDALVHPWLQVEHTMSTAPDGRLQRSAMPRLSAVQLAGMDPGLARFLGFATAFDDLPASDPQDGWDVLAAVGLFAFNPDSFTVDGAPFAQQLAVADPLESMLNNFLMESLQSFTADIDVHEAIARLCADADHQHLVTRSLVTFASPVAPCLAPTLPRPQQWQHHWQTDQAGGVSSLYRIGLAFPDAPLTSLSAAAVQLGGAWSSRHDMVSVGDHVPARRAVPRALGYEREASARVHALNLPSIPHEAAALLTDHDLPAEAGTLAYQVSAADCFGRFGPPVTFDVTPPDRPLPPPPVLRFEIVWKSPPPDSADLLSPGQLNLIFAVPADPPALAFPEALTPGQASAMQVPSTAELAAGSLKIVKAVGSLDDQVWTVDFTLPGLIKHVLVLPELSPMDQRTVTLKLAFEDSLGHRSRDAVQTLHLVDARPPHVIPTGIGLIWTSPPGPSSDVELGLRWPGAPGTLYRVYITDEAGLGLSPDALGGSPNVGPSRGRVAQVGSHRVLDGGTVDRQRFHLLTDTPIIAGADGQVRLSTKLPRSLTTVQFLRVVPMGERGVEAPFDRCGIVPVAVPESRRPVPPRLDGHVDLDTGHATLMVSAPGIDRAVLERDEPGLFAPGADGHNAPTYRLRRAAGPVGDPVYARPVLGGDLVLDADSNDWRATATDTNSGRGLEPFVTYVYWAEYQLPPERNIPAGVEPLRPPGGIEADHMVNAEPAPRPTSVASAPRALMWVPQGLPDLPGPEAIMARRSAPAPDGQVTLTVRVTNPPRAHALAIAPYRVAIWTRWTDHALQALIDVGAAGALATWPILTDSDMTFSLALPADVVPGSSLSLRIAVIDPVGRLSAITPPLDVPEN